MNNSTQLDAGLFEPWLQELTGSLKGNGSTKVNCGECRGCCRSSYFIPIEKDEKATLKKIPVYLLFNLPGDKSGQKFIAIDKQGACAMLKNANCSIYPTRPQACRTYDCRVFSAANLFPSEKNQFEIAERARKWVFSYQSDEGIEIHNAIKEVASFIRRAGYAFPDGRYPVRIEDVAVTAIKASSVALDPKFKLLTDREKALAIINAVKNF